MTPQELDERIATKVSQWFGEPVPAVEDDIKQLIRDCIEVVTPDPKVDFGLVTNRPPREFNQAIDTIQANTKELLG